MRGAIIPRMASEIGLDRHRQYDGGSELDPDQIDRLQLNDLRTRVFMIINEYR